MVYSLLWQVDYSFSGVEATSRFYIGDCKEAQMRSLVMEKWGTIFPNVLVWLTKVEKGILKVKYLKEGKCNKVTKLKEAVYATINFMLYMLGKR